MHEHIGCTGYDLVPKPPSRRPLVKERGQRRLSGQIFWHKYFIGLAEVESRTQGSRARTQKKSDIKDTDASVHQIKFLSDLQKREIKKVFANFP